MVLQLEIYLQDYDSCICQNCFYDLSQPWVRSEKYLAFDVCSCLSCLSFLFNDFIDKGNGAMHEDVVLWIACGAIYDTVIPLGIILAYSKLR